MNFPELDTNLTRGHFETLLQDKELCAALSSWRSLCGRQVDPPDLLQHLWNTHAKHCNRGSLYYKYLTSFQQRQQSCSVCESHPAAAQCPVLLQVAALLAILHHGHGQQRSTEDHAGGTPQQDTQAAIDRLFGSIDPDLGETTIPPLSCRTRL